jgi:hypothetical protein
MTINTPANWEPKTTSLFMSCTTLGLFLDYEFCATKSIILFLNLQALPISISLANRTNGEQRPAIQKINRVCQLQWLPTIDPKREFGVDGMSENQGFTTNATLS